MISYFLKSAINQEGNGCTLLHHAIPISIESARTYFRNTFCFITRQYLLVTFQHSVEATKATTIEQIKNPTIYQKLAQTTKYKPRQATNQIVHLSTLHNIRSQIISQTFNFSVLHSKITNTPCFPFLLTIPIITTSIDNRSSRQRDIQLSNL